MDERLYQRLKPLFEQALEMPKEKRAQFVIEVCQDDHELRKKLQALIAAHEEKTGALDHPLANLNALISKPPQTFSNGELLLGRFKIVRYIDSGGMGEVYEAEDILLQGVHVALKTILPHIAADPDLQRRFKKEVLLAREVTHSNLCPIYDIFHCAGPPADFLFLTMKLLSGETLTQRIHSGELIPGEEGEAILRQVVLGLAAIHAAGIVHRDIKPNNIMVKGNGANLHLWITDFGLARAYETQSTVSANGAVAGTPGYIAPELFLGHLPSHASDLFALGIVLHEVFTGQKPTPIPGTHSYTVSPRLAATKVPDLSVRLITECLRDNPQRRCTAFAEVLEIVASKIDRSHYTGEARQFLTRRQFAVTAAVGVCAMAGGAWWKWDDMESALHPLPVKRFVALLNWPKTSDAQVTPMLNGAIGAIKNELSRIEAFDRDLFVISPEDSPEDLSRSVAAVGLKEICVPLGANLALAASASFVSKHFQLLLQLLDPPSNRVLREKKLAYPLAEITSVPGKAVHAAGSLLNLSRYLHATSQAGPGTQSAAAFTAFQSGKALRDEPNDTELDSAIEKFKQAVELDPHYALAHAELAEAYAHSYGLRHDPTTLELARGNCERALALDPTLVDAHLVRAVLLEKTGNEQGALDEFEKALALDPSNPETLWEQAQVYVRLNRWADAERIYERIISQRPNSWVTYNEKGYVLGRQGKYREAVQAFRTATVASPGCSLAFANLGGEYLEIGEFQESAESSKKSMALRPNALAAVNTSQALRYQGKAHEALPFALKSVELDRADDTNWLELGDCYTSLGNRPREARDAYLRAAKEAQTHLDTDPADGAKWMLLALYKVKSGEPGNALSLIQKADGLGSRDINSQLYKVRVLELVGKRDQALATVSDCFRRGATTLQIAAFPDMQPLQKDPRYLQLVQSISTSISHQVSG